MAGLANALSAIFQRIGVQNAPADTVMNIKLIRHAFSNAIWFVGLAMIVVGFLSRLSHSTSASSAPSSPW